MKKAVLAAMFVLICGISSDAALSHSIYIKENPTNDTGLEFGVDNAGGFVRWRAYVRGLANNSQGQNTGWHDAGNGWWYYDLSSISQRVMWRLDGLENQKYVITYWVFRPDNTWDYGSQVEVISDQVVPNARFSNLVNNTVYDQETINIQVSSSDNLSGVAAIRIYCLVPAGYSLSGWLPSGIANQFYKEFSSATVNYDFTAPGDGIYTFTLWVKDKAGNIAYEPGGPVTVSVDLPGIQPPPAQPPADPSNFQSVSSNQSVTLSWRDNASDEDGYKVFRNDVLIRTLGPNTESCTDSSLDYGRYVYKLYAYKGQLTSNAVEISVTLTAPVDDYRYADSFVYPMDCDKIYRLEPDNQIPTGACVDYQPFGSLFAYSDKVHLGSDLNLKGVNDLGKPVYVIGNALVWDYGWTNGWGNYLILRIQSYPNQPFLLTDSGEAAEIYVLYGHLNEIRVIKPNGLVIEKTALVKKQTYLQQGWQLGTVGDANGLYSPHLHWEIRINGYSQLGPGYWPVSDLTYLENFVDPLEFLANNWSVDSSPQVFVHGYDRDSSRQSYLELSSGLWQRQGRVYDGLPFASVGWANHLWLTSSANIASVYWHYYVPISGAYSVYIILPRYYGQASGVEYKIWHSTDDAINPYRVQLDQVNDDANKIVYLGTFDFHANWSYAVEMLSKTNDQPAATVAADAIRLVYEGDFGTGGGPILPPFPNQSLQTIYSIGTLLFRYEGTYNYPQLLCWGSGLENLNPLLSNGTKQDTVSVLDSDSIYCNIQFEDGQWMGAWYGIMPGQRLFANETEITTALDNGQGGTNLVFNLVVEPNEDDNNPPDDQPPDDDSDWHGTIDVNVSGGGSGTGGCQLSEGNAASFSLVNFLIMFVPLIIITGYKLARALKSS